MEIIPHKATKGNTINVLKLDKNTFLFPYATIIYVDFLKMTAVKLGYSGATGSDHRTKSVAVREVAKDTIQHLLG